MEGRVSRMGKARAIEQALRLRLGRWNLSQRKIDRRAHLRASIDWSFRRWHQGQEFMFCGLYTMTTHPPLFVT